MTNRPTDLANFCKARNSWSKQRWVRLSTKVCKDGFFVHNLQLTVLYSIHTVHVVQYSGKQGWEFAHFALIKWAAVSDSLRSLKTNERPWANRSGRSEEMSDRERIAQVTQDKWATVSDSLRSLKTNEQPWGIRSGRSEEISEWAICSKNFG